MGSKTLVAVEVTEEEKKKKKMVLILAPVLVSSLHKQSNSIDRDRRWREDTNQNLLALIRGIQIPEVAGSPIFSHASMTYWRGVPWYIPTLLSTFYIKAQNKRRARVT